MDIFLNILLLLLIYCTGKPETKQDLKIQFESSKIIHMFTNNSMELNNIIREYKFKKTIQAFDPNLPLNSDNLGVTYTLNGDTIQYYKSSSNQMALFYCSIKNVNKFSNKIPFFKYIKPEIMPKKHMNKNGFIILDEAGFERLEIIFVNNKITNVKYAAHPD